MHGIKLMTVAFVAAMATLFLTVPHTQAQTCGDPDDMGGITEADGISTLRAAANLSTPCLNTTCDVNNDGLITDVDVVNVLRAVEGLSATLGCVSAEINEVVSQVETGPGTPPGMLIVGAAPIPGAANTIDMVEGNTTVVPGGSSTVKVSYDATAQQAAQAQAAAVDANHLDDFFMAFCINTAAGAQEDFLDGCFQIPLAELQGIVEITASFPASLQREVLLCPITILNGEPGAYGALGWDPTPPPSGPLQVTLSYTPDNTDVDVFLDEPAPGETIGFSNPMSSVTGGMLSMDAGFPCGQNQIGNEVISYPEQTSEPLPGPHVAIVAYQSDCDTQAVVDWSLVITTNGDRQVFSGVFSQSGAFMEIPFNFTPEP